MAEQRSIQSMETVTANGGPIVPPPDAVILLARIDAILDELYAMRQTVREWVDMPGGQADVMREPVEEIVRDTTEATRTPVATPHPDTSLTNELAGAAGQEKSDEIYSNAEITHMRFGEPIIGADFVAELSGSLGPAQPDEFEYFNSFDLAWERFAK